MHLHFGSIGVRDLDVHKLPYYSNEDKALYVTWYRGPLSSSSQRRESNLSLVTLSLFRAPKAVSEYRKREGREERLISILHHNTRVL
jgi:hypothetical protein